MSAVLLPIISQIATMILGGVAGIVPKVLDQWTYRQTKELEMARLEQEHRFQVEILRLEKEKAIIEGEYRVVEKDYDTSAQNLATVNKSQTDLLGILAGLGDSWPTRVIAALSTLFRPWLSYAVAVLVLLVALGVINKPVDPVWTLIASTFETIFWFWFGAREVRKVNLPR